MYTADFLSFVWILLWTSFAISEGMFALETAVASCRESAKKEIVFEFDEPHLVHDGEVAALQPNECPQTHLRNCHSSLT